MVTHQNSPESRSRGREIVLNVGAIAGLICVFAAAASFLFGVKPLVFRSGSMSPEIPTGALAFSSPVSAGDLKAGDVVSVVNDQGTRITHRIHEIVSADGASAVLILKGDANKDADISPYTVTEVDRVFFSLPGLGYAVSWLSSPAAIFLGGALVGGVMVLAFGPSAKRKDDNDSGDIDGVGGPGVHQTVGQPEIAASGSRSTGADQVPGQSFHTRRVLSSRTAMVLGSVGLTVLATSVVGTSAAFADSAAASSSFSSQTDLLPAPKWLGCTGGSGGVTMKWAHLGPGYTYDIKLYSGRGGSWNPTIPAKKGDEISIWVSYWDHVRETASESYIEVKAKRNGDTGTAYSGEKIWSSGVATGWCNGARSSGVQAASLVAGGDDASLLKSPARAGTLQAVPPLSGETTTPSVTNSATPSASPSTTRSTTTTSATSVPATTVTSTIAPTTSTTSTTTTTGPSTTSTTTLPKTPAASTSTTGAPQLAGVAASPSGAYVISVSGSKVVVRGVAGDELFSRSVSNDADVQWDPAEDLLWIVDDGTIYRVTPGTWSAVPIDPTSMAVPARIAALAK